MRGRVGQAPNRAHPARCSRAAGQFRGVDPALAVPACGDGILDQGEGCDDGPNNEDAPDACRSSCTPASYGEGVVDTDEACDAGGAKSDTQGNACRLSCSLPSCGDGVIDSDSGERCDDGPLNSDTAIEACRTTCVRTKLPVCGDVIVDDDEGCDDGNDNPADGCDACRVQRFVSELVVRGSVGRHEALQTALRTPLGIAVDALGRVYIADSLNHIVRRLDLDAS